MAACVAYTYNDSVTFLEYAIETAIASRVYGIKSVAAPPATSPRGPRRRRHGDEPLLTAGAKLSHTVHRGGTMQALLALFAGIFVAALAAKPAHAGPGTLPCSAARFVTAGGAPLLAGNAGTVIDVVLLDDGDVALPNGCGPVRARLKRTGYGMRLRAHWSSCEGLRGRVLLKARVDHACGTMAGVVRARREGLKRPFEARRISTCGDGILDPGEGCDDGSTMGGDCCSPSCRLEHGVACEPPPPSPPNCGPPPDSDSASASDCPPHEFCEQPPGACGTADLGGSCVPVSDACPRIFAPVCGCDGVTYPNDCVRRGARAQKAHDGPCECRGAPVCLPGTRGVDLDADGCEDGCAPCPSTSCPQPGMAADIDGDACADTCLPGFCATSAECADDFYCAKRLSECGARGVCVRRPRVCPEVAAPVCGCDGQTYGNACEAAAAGVAVRSRGRCECRAIPCSPGTRPVDQDGDGCPERCLTPCADLCDCAANPDLVFGDPCPLLCVQCGNYWACEDGRCVEHCGPIPPEVLECREPPVCAGNADCRRDEFCVTPPGKCGARGRCEVRPLGCPDVVAPVCGCDGQTYGNRCDAAAAGVSVASRGPCRERCGTIVGIPCPDGHFCELPADTCDSADLGGVCLPLPDACPAVFQPVCGCDGRTYANDCERQARLVQKAHDGPCDCKPLRCRAGFVPDDSDGDGCPDGCTPACRETCSCYEGGSPEPRFPCLLECATCDTFWTCEDGGCRENCGPVPPDVLECLRPR